MSLFTYCPEMNEVKPESEIEAIITHGEKWYVKSTSNFSGRGIACHGETMPTRPGWKTYTMTQSAFKKIAQGKSVAVESLLN